MSKHPVQVMKSKSELNTIELIESSGIEITGSINNVSPKFNIVSLPISTVTKVGSINTILSNTSRQPLASLIWSVLLLPERLDQDLTEVNGPPFNEYRIGGKPPLISVTLIYPSLKPKQVGPSLSITIP